MEKERGKVKDREKERETEIKTEENGNEIEKERDSVWMCVKEKMGEREKDIVRGRSLRKAREADGSCLEGDGSLRRGREKENRKKLVVDHLSHYLTLDIFD